MESDIIREIAVPLKRNDFLFEAHNVYKFLYVRFGSSDPLFNSWFKVIACAGMIEEAKLLLLAENNIYFNNYTREAIYPAPCTQYEYHFRQLQECQADINHRKNYLKTISGNPVFIEKFINLDIQGGYNIMPNSRDVNDSMNTIKMEQNKPNISFNIMELGQLSDRIHKCSSNFELEACIIFIKIILTLELVMISELRF